MDIGPADNNSTCPHCANGTGIAFRVTVDGSRFKKVTLRCQSCRESWIVHEESAEPLLLRLYEHPFRRKPDRRANGS